MKIIIDKDIPFVAGALEKYADVVYLEGGSITRNDVVDADALIVRTRTKCNSDLLRQTKVRFIASATIGFDHIDTAYCDANDIHWTNAPGCNSSSVQQYVGAALFHLASKLEFSLSDKTIGVVGVGNVGAKIAAFCRTIGMRVLLNDPPRERREGKGSFVSLETIIREADIITLHVPLNLEGKDKTFHFFDDRIFSQLQSHQVLINTSRGEIIDTPALLTALRHKKLAACVQDVWENEPEIDVDFLNLVDIGTPHIAGYSIEGKANGTAMSVRAVSRFFNLGTDDWFPDRLPSPNNEEVEFDCTSMRREKIVCKLIRNTYDILSDDQRLRNSPRTFEQQRSAYPLRREFPFYAAKLLHADEVTLSLARRIGFRVNPQ